MLKRFRHYQGQSLLEYLMMIIIITAALLAMQTYIQRAINARLKQVQVELNEAKR